jgi:hypothetical protein
MRIALLAGASPRTCDVGPKVRLGKGTWNILFDGVVDSTLVMVKDQVTSSPIEHGLALDLTETTTVALVFKERGTESFITVTAESQ